MIIDLTDQMSIEAAKLYCEKPEVVSVGITSGCFDMFHYMHLYYLQRCKQLCNVLLVGVDSDRKIKEEKKPVAGVERPLVSEKRRLALIDALKCVDGCFILDSLPQLGYICDTFIRKKEYGKVFRNQDWVGHEDEVEVGHSNARVIIVPDVEDTGSTTGLIQKILASKNE